MESTILSINNVNKSFGGVITSKNVTFDVPRGAIYGLIGPNGAGKSTLMNVISGFYSADSGSILLDGKEISHLPPHTRSRLGIGRTFQTPRFLSRANIDVNLRLGDDLKNHHIGYLKSYFSSQNKNFENDLDELMRLTGFSIDLNEKISSLTYGQQKILEIVRAMLASPKIMLVDEPCAGLNDKECENVVAMLRDAAYNRGIGVLLIEHSMDVVMQICEQIVVLNFGEVIANGSPEQILSNEEVIAAYLGRDKD